MHIDTSTTRRGGKTYTRYLLRDSYRENGTTKHHTIANLSGCSLEEIAAIRLALKHKKDLACLENELKKEKDDGEARQKLNFDFSAISQGKSFGAVYVVAEMAKRLGIAKALGNDRQGKLALWQIISRVIDQGSRLSAVRLARAQAVGDVLRLDRFDEDDLYANLDWLAEHQAEIEQSLFRQQKLAGDGLFLYDVTSSYLEGEQNAFAAWGYNRDKKKGKKQVVVGLLCNSRGRPLSIEVFDGNTQDTETFASQVHKLVARFDCNDVTFVGDRGMIRGPQIAEIEKNGFHYITAISKPQIEKLLHQDVLQLDLFDEQLVDIEANSAAAEDEEDKVLSTEEKPHSPQSVRYILKRNPVRVAELAKSHSDKYSSVEKKVAEANVYLSQHAKARPATCQKALEAKLKKLGVADWASITLSERSFAVKRNEEAYREATKLDGCYVIKTDLSREAGSKETVHDRYKDLAEVEWAFRTSKTAHLEMRPIYVRLASRTRGHVLVIMLAYTIVQALAEAWRPLDTTVEEGLKSLTTLCLTEIALPDQTRLVGLPAPRADIRELLRQANIVLPKKITPAASHVSTKRKLNKERT
jgi:transposase